MRIRTKSFEKVAAASLGLGGPNLLTLSMKTRRERIGQRRPHPSPEDRQIKEAAQNPGFERDVCTGWARPNRLALGQPRLLLSEPADSPGRRNKSDL